MPEVYSEYALQIIRKDEVFHGLLYPIFWQTENLFAFLKGNFTLTFGQSRNSLAALSWSKANQKDDKQQFSLEPSLFTATLLKKQFNHEFNITAAAVPFYFWCKEAFKHSSQQENSAHS